MLETMNFSSQDYSEEQWAEGEESTTVIIALLNSFGVKLLRALPGKILVYTLLSCHSHLF